jgi:hypothetical protein
MSTSCKSLNPENPDSDKKNPVNPNQKSNFVRRQSSIKIT